MEKAWTITDADGSNARQVTLAQFRAEIEAAKKSAEQAARRMYGDKIVDRVAARSKRS